MFIYFLISSVLFCVLCSDPFVFIGSGISREILREIFREILREISCVRFLARESTLNVPVYSGMIDLDLSLVSKLSF